MPYYVSDECTMCMVCVQECPEDAVRDLETKMYIDEDKCNDCGICAEMCPEGVIKKR